MWIELKRTLSEGSLSTPSWGVERFELHMNASDESDAGTAVITRPKTETKTPSFYRVLLMNDDFTPMDFVIHVLQKFFNKDHTEATQIMLQVHHKGSGQCGVFAYEIAETKVFQVNQYSKQNRYPLKCTMEKA